MKGFLGTWASFSADLNLVIQIAMGVALLVGAFLARAKRYAAHGASQAAVLIPQPSDDCYRHVAVPTYASCAETLQSSLETKLRHCHGPRCPKCFGRDFRSVYPAGRRNEHSSPFMAVSTLEAMDAD
jgi:hypothetical protein